LLSGPLPLAQVSRSNFSLRDLLLSLGNPKTALAAWQVSR
jgi:hypothetical protein